MDCTMVYSIFSVAAADHIDSLFGTSLRSSFSPLSYLATPDHTQRSLQSSHRRKVCVARVERAMSILFLCTTKTVTRGV